MTQNKNTQALIDDDELQEVFTGRDFGVKLYIEAEEWHIQLERAEEEGDLICYNFHAPFSVISFLEDVRELEPRKVCIHPDSYHIFELKDGDVVHIKLRGFDEYGTAGKGGQVLLSDGWLLGDEYELVKILQRNGKLFPWPEVENA